jgi:hypothetical protein
MITSDAGDIDISEASVIHRYSKTTVVTAFEDIRRMALNDEESLQETMDCLLKKENVTDAQENIRKLSVKLADRWGSTVWDAPRSSSCWIADKETVFSLSI